MRTLRRTTIIALVIIALSLATLSLGFVLAPPPASNAPMPLSEYGVVRVYASVFFTGNTQIKITADGLNPFYVSRLTLFVDNPADVDIVLYSVKIDGIGPIQVSGQSAASKVAVIPAGLRVGDVVTSFPASLSMLIAKDPMGNDAIVANGGDGSGIVLGVRFLSTSGSVGTLSTIATVIAATNSTVTMTMS